MQVTVIGNGGFGTAMATVALGAGHAVRIWGHDEAYTAEVAKTRLNPRYLKGITLPDEVLITHDPAAALADAELVLVAVPTQHIRDTMQKLVSHLPEGVALVSLAKGLEQGTAKRPSEILQEVCPGHPVLVLSGPSHAEEVAQQQPAAVVLAGERIEAVQEALSTRAFRVYGNSDLLGVELCGAVKNVMAVAAGMADGMGLGDNAKAAVLSRGIVEMARYGVAEGAQLETFFGLAGMGDLAVTAFSRHGRNRAFGERVGRGETLAQILDSTHKVAEGVWTSQVVVERAKQLGVDMPICEAVVAVLFGGVAADEAVVQLMQRDRKEEVLR